MKIEQHLELLKESLDIINTCINDGVENRQRTIGFLTSSACADMIEIILHQNCLIDPGFVIKHEWFAAPNKIKEKFTFDFPRKDDLIPIVRKIEENRNIFCYGKKQSKEKINLQLDNFNAVKDIFSEVTKYEV